MKGAVQILISGLLLAALTIGPRAMAQALKANSERVLVVSLEDRKLALLEDGVVKKVYTVAVGKPTTPSPVGHFTIERRVANPTYSHEGQVIPPGPGNPVGTRWMGLSVHGYGIHGTNAPKSIGKAASHGCIRMSKTDLEELFALVQAGDSVEIVGQRNEETAQLFGGAIPQPIQEPMQTARITEPQPVSTAVDVPSQPAAQAAQASAASVSAQ